MAEAIVLGAVGDIFLARGLADNIRRHGPAWPFAEVMPAFDKADLLFGNMESVILPPDYPAGQIDPRGHVCAFDGTKALQEAGFDFMNLANNHILDGGTAGMFHTRKVLQDRGIAAGGVGEDQAQARQMQIVEKKGLRVGFLCYAEDSNHILSTPGPGYAYYEPQAVIEDIRRFRGQVDALVVSIHADLEYQETPSVPRRDISRRLAEAGADVILEHHPHVPQGVQKVGKCLIAYSLGNFYYPAHSCGSAQSIARGAADTYVLLVELSSRGRGVFFEGAGANLPPPDERPCLARDDHQRRILANLEELDRKVLDDALVKSNWRQAAMRQMEWHLRMLGKLDDPQLMRQQLASLLFVAENRSWAQEVYQALQEEWPPPGAADPYHKPSFEFARLLQSARRRPLRALARRIHAAIKRKIGRS